MAEVLIRPYRDTDRAVVIDLLHQVFAYPDPHNAPHLVVDRKAAFQRELFQVAEHEMQVVAMAMGGYDGHRGWIYSVAVRPDMRGQGIGKRLIGEIERRLDGLGCPKVNLQVLADNRDVVAFYESLGYNVEQRISLGKRLIG